MEVRPLDGLPGMGNFQQSRCRSLRIVKMRSVIVIFFLKRDPSALLGTDSLAHQWPRTLLYAFPPVVLIQPTLEGAPGGLIIDSCGSPLVQAAFVCRDQSPFRRGPVVPGTRAGLAQEVGYSVPMGRAPERANLMTRGLPQCYCYHSVCKGALH